MCGNNFRLWSFKEIAEMGMRIWWQSFRDDETGGSYWDHLRRYLGEAGESGTIIDVKGITPPEIYAHPIEEFRCAREVICNAVTAEREGYDAFVIGHFQDSGLYEARSVVDIPVVALGEASMLHACQLGQRIGLVSLNPRLTPVFHHQIAKYGLERRITGVHAMHFEPGQGGLSQVIEAYDSDIVAARVAQLFADQARPLVAKGCDVLIPAGGIPMLLFSSIKNHTVDGAPIINGIPILLKHAETAVKLRRLTGMGVSRVSDYIQPPTEITEEFLAHPQGS
jgi:Asp/Glu/hydantoin racemase